MRWSVVIFAAAPGSFSSYIAQRTISGQIPSNITTSLANQIAGLSTNPTLPLLSSAIAEHEAKQRELKQLQQQLVSLQQDKVDPAAKPLSISEEKSTETKQTEANSESTEEKNSSQEAKVIN